MVNYSLDLYDVYGLWDCYFIVKLFEENVGTEDIEDLLNDYIYNSKSIIRVLFWINFIFFVLNVSIKLLTVI